MAENFDVEKAQREYEAARGEDDPEPGEIEDDEDDDAPPGFLSFDDYVKQGGDPEMYRGRKAYETEHDRINENKALRREIKGMRATVQQTMESVNDWQRGEREKIRGELEADLHKAKEDEDLDGALTAQQKLDKLDDAPAAQPTREENPVIAEFRTANPRLDPDSEDYNEEFDADVAGFYNDLYNKLSRDGRVAVTDGQIKRCLHKAMKDAMELHGDNAPKNKDIDEEPGESRRNTRGRGAGATRRRASRTPAAPKAEDYAIEKSAIRREDNPAPAIRERIRETALKKALKDGKPEADAKKYADDQAENFEKAIAQ